LPGGGDYVPHDYDERLRGPVRLREALGNSLNVPAVDTIHRLGTARVLERLRAFGFASLTEDAEHYGPALALGDGEVTLLALANAYATLARGGLLRPVRVVRRLGDSPLNPTAEPRRVVDERIAGMLTDILADKEARMSAFGDQNALELDFDVAAKTGTSKGYRDNVAVGYTAELTVAVWAGNFDGSPMADVSGITGAGPIFHDVMLAASRLRPARAPLVLAARPEGARSGLERTTVCALSGEIATAACPHRVHEWLPVGDADHAPPCSVHERVRVDRQNGLPAGAACEASETTSRVFERWPSPFAAWANQSGRSVLPEESSPRCPVDPGSSGEEPSSGSGELRIAYPFDGARFVLDPERPPELQLLDVRVEPEARDVEVAVDGKAVRGRRWPLAPGEHILTASRKGRSSSPVRIVVRGE
jgi:penicillin-binding protein 1C